MAMTATNAIIIMNRQGTSRGAERGFTGLAPSHPNTTVSARATAAIVRETGRVTATPTLGAGRRPVEPGRAAFTPVPPVVRSAFLERWEP